MNRLSRLMRPTCLLARSGKAARPTAARSRPHPIEALERRAMMSADLAVSDLSIRESSARAGAEIHTEWTYTNVGDAFQGAWNTELRLSLDDVWGNADDVVLAVQRDSEDLEAGQSSLEHESVIVPATTPAGTYRLAAFIDSASELVENSESNNIAFSSGMIAVTSGGGGGGGGTGLDLTVGDVSGAIQQSGENDEIEATWTYTNAGSSFNGFFDQEVRLSLNQVWGDSDDIVLGVKREAEDLLPGQSSVESESFNLPAGVAAGEYFLGVFVDSTGAVSETNENNNVAWSAQALAISGGGGGGGGVDLTLADVLANPTPRPVGEDIEIGWTIVNAGGSFTGAFDQQVRLSIDSVWGNADDIVLGVVRESEDYQSGQRSQESESFVIPGGTASGSYFVLVRIDSSEEITETDEANNVAVSSTALVSVGDSSPTEDRRYALFSHGRHVEDDDFSPSRDDSTVFGRRRVDGRYSESEFEIHNFGSDDLVLENVRLRGRHRDDYSIAVAPSETLAPGASTTIVIRFDPSKGGYRNAILVVETNRAADDRYEFRMRGSGVVPTDAADATVLGRRDRAIEDDDSRPGGGDGTRFRTLEAGNAHERTFELRNDGTQSLVLSTPLIRLTGGGADAFSIVSMPAMTLAPGATTTFTVRFAPTTTGKFVSQVEILSNDPDEAVYDFRIIGRGV